MIEEYSPELYTVLGEGQIQCMLRERAVLSLAEQAPMKGQIAAV